MTEKVLPYNRDLVPQETGWWCGPASAQTVLNTREIHFDESWLAQQCNTHEGGTDYIGQITAVLNEYVHDADYITVDLPLDPPSDAQIEEFWTNLKSSIDAGFGVVGNFVSPSDNPPRPQRGSGPAPTFYGSGTIYHYVSFMGWAEENGERYVWVVDSGGHPFGYWITLRQCALLMAPKGYSYARVHGQVGVPNPAGPDDAVLLAYAMGESLPLDRYRELLPQVREALEQSQCYTPRRAAQWIAQIGHESAGLLYMEEIADGWAYEGRADLGNTEPGDGPRFKGHGPIQITGRFNHAAVSEWAFERGLVPSATYFLEFPGELGGDRYGFLGAVWYWTVARPGINAMADSEDLEGVTRAINGGLNGLEDRRSRYWRALEVASAFVADMDHPSTADVVYREPEPVYREPEPVQPTYETVTSTYGGTPLTGYPHHHSQDEDLESQLRNIRAEGLLTQALVFALAERAGIEARELYDRVREGF
jgi:predicted chitinase